MFTDTSILVAGESALDSQKEGDETIHMQASYNNQDGHVQRMQEDHAREINEVARITQAERQNLYEKLSQAEQVLEQITEELALLSSENRFLSKLNQRLTYHACR